MTEAEFEQCINRICHGDRQGLKDIYEAYLPYLYRTVYGIVLNREDAEDITGDFFVKLWSLAPKYRPGGGHKGYLATIARNMAVDYLRKHRREIPMGDPERRSNASRTGHPLSFSESAETEGCGDASGGSEHRTRAGTPETKPNRTPEEQVVANLSLQEALASLKPDEKRIISMKVLGEMTFAEISQLLGIPMGTVTWKYQEGIKRLRRYGYE